MVFKTAQNILRTHTKEIKIKTNDGTDSKLFTMAYLHLFVSLSTYKFRLFWSKFEIFEVI